MLTATTRKALMTGFVILGFVTGCSDVQETGQLTRSTSSAQRCLGCHGTDNAAPPKDTHGNSATSLRTVGAHQAHLKGTLGRPMSCAECHVVPLTADAVGHMDGGSAEVTFGPFSRIKGVKAAWNPERGTCTTYCHGATMGGEAPVWTKVDGSQKNCSSCHGFPPAGGHPNSTRCYNCHAQTVGPDGEIASLGTHLNGNVELSGGGDCNSCHGNEANAAPPRDLAGNTSSAAITVGAHQSHVGRGMWCSECHVAPATIGDPSHMNGVTEMAFSALAGANGVRAYWDRGSATCVTYCHGVTLRGGVNTRPVWTAAGQAGCGSCHGNPPPPPHPASAKCAKCHDGARHVDGVVQFVHDGACNSCHGSARNAAPPEDTSGRSNTSAVTVGAHQSHLGAKIGRTVTCGECHSVPSKLDAPGHMNGAPDVRLSASSSNDGVSARWNPESATCTTYCHGASFKGGQQTRPVWNKVDGTQMRCTSCHGNPPPPPHPQAKRCAGCHDETLAADGTIAHPEKHIDGKVQATGCTGCHGSAQNAAPPADTSGNTATTEISVGAHQAHLNSRLSAPIACSQCHVDPSDAEAPSHMNGAADVVYGERWRKGGVTPSWNRGSVTCTTYCHGASLEGGTATAPVWNKVDGTQKTCTSCHGASPRTGKHPSKFEDHAFMGKDCSYCHAAVIDSTGTTILKPELHANGTVNVDIPDGRWNPAKKTCTIMCHSSKRW